MFKTSLYNLKKTKDVNFAINKIIKKWITKYKTKDKCTLM